MKFKYRRIMLSLSLAALLPAGAMAQITVGATLSSTGPQASLGIPERNTLMMLPAEIAGQSVRYVILDDASNTNTTIFNTNKLVSEEKADVIIGSSTTPNTLAMLDTIGRTQTPVISLASSARLIEPVEGDRRWMFKTPHSDSLMAGGIARHAAAHKIRTIAYIGFSNALGETFWAEVERAAKNAGLEITGKESFAPTDTTVTAQVLKIMQGKPDAVVIGGSGTPAATPARTLKERGYTGTIYFNHGVANNDFLRVCADACEGAWVPVGPITVASLLPDSHPVKAVTAAFEKKYDAKYGAGSASLFAAYAWDAGLLLQQAIPQALKHGKPGTVEFRSALRDALESVKDLPTATGIVSMSPTDHNGLDGRALVMATVKDGHWALDKP